MAISGSSGAWYRSSSINSDDLALGSSAYSLHCRVRGPASPTTAATSTFMQYVGSGSRTNNPFPQLIWDHPNASFIKSSAHKNNAGSFASAAVSGTPSANTWYSWLMVYDGTVKTYLDGALQATSAAIGVAATNSVGSVDLFANVTTTGVVSGLFSGQIADAAIWAAALTADEAASLGKGFSAKLIRPASRVWHMPLVRDFVETRNAKSVTRQAGSDVIFDHPRLIGG